MCASAIKNLINIANVVINYYTIKQLIFKEIEFLRLLRIYFKIGYIVDKVLRMSM